MADITTNILQIGSDNLVLQDADAQAKLATNTQKIAVLEEDMSSKAEIDGYYEDMTVGDSEQLVASQYVEDSVPYNFRTTGGSADVGNREYVDSIVGGTVAWNQLLSGIREDSTAQGLTFVGSGTFTSTITGTGTGGIARVSKDTSINFVEGHKYFASWDDSTLPNGTLIVFGNNQSRGFVNCNGKTASVGVCAESNSLYLGLQTVAAEYNNTLTISLHDLTQMFGSTIADYIYSLEQATAGAGVAWFRKLFPKDYYEYNAGELLSVSGLASHDTVGFNQWDEEWELGYWNNGIKTAVGTNICSANKILINPNTTYYIKTPSQIYYTFYDSEGNFLPITGYDEQGRLSMDSSGLVTTPSGAHFMTFNMGSIYGTTYKNDICINLSWSGWRNGEYEPYQKHSYPLDSDLVLRGIPKLDASNSLYYDGDTYESDGTVTRKYGVVDLGTLAWTRHADGCFYADIPTKTQISEDVNLICGKYIAYTQNASGVYDAFSYTPDKTITGIQRTTPGANSWVYVKDTSYTDVETFKTAMSGVMLVYELATPTTETAEPYQHIQVCDDFGTEEYVNTSIVPVGHNTRYPANLRDKLQHLPDLADDDGYYMIGQSNKQMHLELFRIPKAPTADGTYTLKATVSGGTPTYTWEAQA